LDIKLSNALTPNEAPQIRAFTKFGAHAVIASSSKCVSLRGLTPT